MRVVRRGERPELPAVVVNCNSDDDGQDVYERTIANGTGPKNVQEMQQWPCMILDTLTSDVHAPYGPGESGLEDVCFVQSNEESVVTSTMLSRLVNNLDHHLELHMKYAGIDCPAMVLDMLVKALLARGISTGNHIHHMTASDINKKCRKVLQAFPPDMRSSHMHGDVMNQLPANVKSDLLHLGSPERQPSPNASAEVMMAWHTSVRQWLDKVKAVLYAPGSFPPDIEVPCDF